MRQNLVEALAENVSGLLQELHWKTDMLHDDSIPHPPAAPNSANIAQIIDSMKDLGAKPWQGPEDRDETDGDANGSASDALHLRGFL